jgi:hypothetical protein
VIAFWRAFYITTCSTAVSCTATEFATFESFHISSLLLKSCCGRGDVIVHQIEPSILLHELIKLSLYFCQQYSVHLAKITMTTDIHTQRAPQSEMEYLRLDTNLGQKQEHSSTHGILTPISANCDDRKSSISSTSWSFVSQPGSQASQASSVSSFASCTEPSTPPSHGLPMDYPFATSSLSQGTLSASADSSGHRADYSDSSFLQSSPNAIPLNVSFSEGQQWTYAQRPYAIHVYGLQQHGLDSLMPACNDFSSSMAASLIASPDIFHSLHGRVHDPLSWENGTYMSSLAYDQSFRGNDVQGLDGEIDYPWALPVREVVPSSGNVPTSTVVPSEAMPPAFSYASTDMKNYEDIDGGELVLPSPRSDPGSYSGFYEDDVKRESEERDKELMWVDASRSQRKLAFVSSTGAKGVKKAHRGHTSPWLKSARHARVGKRRARDRNVDTYTSTKDVEVLVQATRTPSKTHTCTEQVGKGRCGKAFERVEHLRRHERTHRGVKEIQCPLPKRFNCIKRLDRRDNWRDHLKTHLKKSNSGRNERCERDEMYQALRENETPEEAEKTIEMLEKWHASGRSIASSGAPPRQRQ